MGGDLWIYCCICFYGYEEQKTNVKWLIGSDRDADEACCELTATIHVKMLVSSVPVSSKWDNLLAETRDNRA